MPFEVMERTMAMVLGRSAGVEARETVRDMISVYTFNRGRRKGLKLCIRVLTMSRGWTTRVETAPALRPAIDSTRAGERPALLLEGIKANCRGRIIYMMVVMWKDSGDGAMPATVVRKF